MLWSVTEDSLHRQGHGAQEGKKLKSGRFDNGRQGEQVMEGREGRSSLGGRLPQRILWESGRRKTNKGGPQKFQGKEREKLWKPGREG